MSKFSMNDFEPVNTDIPFDDFMFGYDSPIKMIMGNFETKMENDMMSVVKSYGIDVDKEELIKALKYDRDQYDKGYAEAKRKFEAPSGEILDFTLVGKKKYECSLCHHRIKDYKAPYCAWCGCILTTVTPVLPDKEEDNDDA